MKAADPRVSYAELATWPDDGRRYELYGGEPIVVPAPLGRHQGVVIELVRLLLEHQATAAGRVFVSPIDIVLSPYDVLQPDVVWFGPERARMLDPDEAIAVVPDLAIEVLSRSTEMRDRGRKMRLLGRYGLPEYWIVDPRQHRLEIYRNGWRQLELASEYRMDDEVASASLAPTRFKAGRLFPDARSR